MRLSFSPKEAFFVALLLLSLAFNIQAAAQTPKVYKDARAPVEARVADLLGRMTGEEKITLIAGSTYMYTHAIPRLGIPRLRMSDGPVGVREQEANGAPTLPSTVYAGGLALAASWDVALARRVGASIGRDCRARDVNILLGPGMDMYRDPVGGRNFEYYGEDPLVTGLIATAYIEGVQSQGVAATMKHYVANDQEYDRDHISSEVDERTLREIYLKPFEIAAKTSGVWCVMNSYNPINGVTATANDFINNRVLKGEWGFAGLLMSDWGATHDALAAANGGLDFEMPGPPKFFTQKALAPLLASGQVTQAAIDDKVRRMLRVMISLGFLDRPQRDASIPLDDPASEQVALEGAREGIVLLKNDGHLLPLDASHIKTIVVLGHNADPAVADGGGSAHAEYIRAISVLQGIKDVAGAGVQVIRVPWSTLPATTDFSRAPRDLEHSFANTAYGAGENPPIPPEYSDQVKSADVAVVCVGFNDNVKNEWATMHVRPDAESESIDRTYELPPGQEKLIEAVTRLNPRTVVILNAGGSVATANWLGQTPALIDALYPGQAGGEAIGEILFGKTSPSGKLTFSWEKKIEDSPAYGNFPYLGNRNNTYKEGVFLGYRWFDSKGIEPLFPFGFGLSYTSFDYSGLQITLAANSDPSDELLKRRLTIPPAAKGDLRATFTVRNTGPATGDEVAEVYVAPPPCPVPRPVHELKGFARISLAPGVAKQVRIDIPRERLAYWDPGTKAWTVTPGDYTVEVGSSSRDVKLRGTFKE